MNDAYGYCWRYQNIIWRNLVDRDSWYLFIVDIHLYMSYDLKCYCLVSAAVSVFVWADVSYTVAHSNTLLSFFLCLLHAQYAVEHTVVRAAVVVNLFRKLCTYVRYIFLLKLILYSTQSLSLRKIITNTCNSYILLIDEEDGRELFVVAGFLLMHDSI